MEDTEQAIKKCYELAFRHYQQYASVHGLPSMPSPTTLIGIREIQMINCQIPLSLDSPPDNIGLSAFSFCLDTIMTPILRFRTKFLNGIQQKKVMVIIKIFRTLLKFLRQQNDIYKWLLINMCALYSKIGEAQVSKKILEFAIQLSERSSSKPIFGNVKDLLIILNMEQYRKWINGPCQEKMDSDPANEWEKSLKLKLFVIFSMSSFYLKWSALSQISQSIQRFFQKDLEEFNFLRKLTQTSPKIISYSLHELEKPIPLIQIQIDFYEAAINQKLKTIKLYPSKLKNCKKKQTIEQDVKKIFREMMYDKIDFLIVDSQLTKENILEFKKKFQKMSNFCDFTLYQSLDKGLVALNREGIVNHVLIISGEHLTDASWIGSALQKLIKFYYYGQPLIDLPSSSKIKELKTSSEGEGFLENIRMMDLADDIRKELLHYNQFSFTPNISIINKHKANIDSQKANKTLYFLHFLLLPVNHEQAKEKFIYFIKSTYQNLQSSEKQMLEQMQMMNFQNYQKKQVIGDYTKDAFFFQILNRALRSLSNIKFLSYVQYPVAALFLEIRRRYLEAPPHQKSQKYYRGCYLNENQKQFLKIKGNIFQLQGFFSTSTNSLQPNRFGPHHFILTVPGRKTVDENTAGFADISDSSYFLRENEVLFNPGNHFKVVEYREKGNITEIEAELIFVDQLINRLEGPSQAEKYLQEVILCNLAPQEGSNFLLAGYKTVEKQIEKISKILLNPQAAKSAGQAFSKRQWEQLYEKFSTEKNRQIINYILLKFPQEVQALTNVQQLFVKLLFEQSLRSEYTYFLEDLSLSYFSDLQYQKSKEALELHETILNLLYKFFQKKQRYLEQTMVAFLILRTFNYQAITCKNQADLSEIQKKANRIEEKWKSESSVMHVSKMLRLHIQSIRQKRQRTADSGWMLEIQIAYRKRQFKKVVSIYSRYEFQISWIMKQNRLMKLLIVTHGKIIYSYFTLINSISFAEFYTLQDRNAAKIQRQKLSTELLRVLEKQRQLLSKLSDDDKLGDTLPVIEMKQKLCYQFSAFYRMRNLLSNARNQILQVQEYDNQSKGMKFMKLGQLFSHNQSTKKIGLYYFYKSRLFLQDKNDLLLVQIAIITILRRFLKYELSSEQMMKTNIITQAQEIKIYSLQAINSQLAICCYFQQIGEIKKAVKIILRKTFTLESLRFSSAFDQFTKLIIRVLSYNDFEGNLKKSQFWMALPKNEKIQILERILCTNLPLCNATAIFKVLRLLYLKDIRQYYPKYLQLCQNLKSICKIFVLDPLILFAIQESLNQVANYQLLYQMGEQNYIAIQKQNIKLISQLMDEYFKKYPRVLSIDFKLYEILRDRNFFQKYSFPLQSFMKMEPQLIQHLNKTKLAPYYKWAASLYSILLQHFHEFSDLVNSINHQLRAIKNRSLEELQPIFKDVTQTLKMAFENKFKKMRIRIQSAYFSNEKVKVLEKQHRNLMKLPFSDKRVIRDTFQELAETFDSHLILKRRCFLLALQTSIQMFTFIDPDAEIDTLAYLFTELHACHSEQKDSQLANLYQEMMNLTERISNDDYLCIEAFHQKLQAIRDQEEQKKVSDLRDLKEQWLSQINNDEIVNGIQKLVEFIRRNDLISPPVLDDLALVFEEFYVQTYNPLYIYLLEQNLLKCCQYYQTTKYREYMNVFKKSAKSFLYIVTKYECVQKESLVAIYSELQKNLEEKKMGKDEDEEMAAMFKKWMKGRYCL